MGQRAFHLDGTGQCLLCQDRGQLKISADPHANNEGRAGVGACITNGLQHCALHAFHSVSRLQHELTAHILTAEALGGNGNGELVSRNHIIMNDGRRIILGVQTKERISHNGFPKVSIGIALTHAFVDRFRKTSVDMYLLSHTDKEYGHSRILADGNILFLGDLHILFQLPQNLLAQRTFLLVRCFPECPLHIRRKGKVCGNAHFTHRSDDIGCCYFFHC